MGVAAADLCCSVSHGGGHAVFSLGRLTLRHILQYFRWLTISRSCGVSDRLVRYLDVGFNGLHLFSGLVSLQLGHSNVRVMKYLSHDGLSAGHFLPILHELQR